jgi:hypothetical protein
MFLRGAEMQIDETYYESLTEEKIDRILGGVGVETTRISY